MVFSLLKQRSKKWRHFFIILRLYIVSLLLLGGGLLGDFDSLDGVGLSLLRVELLGHKLGVVTLGVLLCFPLHAVAVLSDFVVHLLVQLLNRLNSSLGC